MTQNSAPEIEEAVLGSMLIDADSVTDFFNIIQTMDVFESPENAMVAKSMKTLYDRNDKIDVLTVAAELKKAGTLKNMGGVKRLAALSSKISSAAHFEIHLRLLLEFYMKRGTALFAQQLLNGALSDTDDVFERVAIVQNGLDGLLNQSIVSDELSIGGILEEESEKWMIENRGGLAGQSTGIPALDKASGGLVDTDLTIIAARPGQGKTAFVLTLMRNLCLKGIPVGIFSLEMSRNQLVQRLLSQESQVFASKIRTNQLDNGDRMRLFEAKKHMATWPIQINDNAGISLRRLKTKAILWKKKHGIKLLVVDYLQLMGSDSKKGNREGEVAEISRGLKVLAKDLKIPIIVLSQLSREVEKRTGKMPQLSDLRESGSIEQDADMVMFLMRPAYYRMDGEMEIEGVNYNCEDLCILDIAKFRAGATGQVALRFNGALMKFTDYGHAIPTPISTDGRVGAFENEIKQPF